MLRRNFLAISGAAGLAARRMSNAAVADLCGCALAPPAATADAFAGLQSGLKITNMKVFGVSYRREADRDQGRKRGRRSRCHACNCRARSR